MKVIMMVPCDWTGKPRIAELEVDDLSPGAQAEAEALIEAFPDGYLDPEIEKLDLPREALTIRIEDRDRVVSISFLPLNKIPGVQFETLRVELSDVLSNQGDK